MEGKGIQWAISGSQSEPVTQTRWSGFLSDTCFKDFKRDSTRSISAGKLFVLITKELQVGYSGLCKGSFFQSGIGRGCGGREGRGPIVADWGKKHLGSARVWSYSSSHCPRLLDSVSKAWKIMDSFTQRWSRLETQKSYNNESSTLQLGKLRVKNSVG